MSSFVKSCFAILGTGFAIAIILNVFIFGTEINQFQAQQEEIQTQVALGTPLSNIKVDEKFELKNIRKTSNYNRNGEVEYILSTDIDFFIIPDLDFEKIYLAYESM